MYNLARPAWCTTSPNSGIKSSFSIALICTTSRRIPASAIINQGSENAIWSLSEGWWKVSRAVQYSKAVNLSLNPDLQILNLIDVIERFAD